MPKIVLIHAVRAAMAPIEVAFGNLWPETKRVNLLDDSLSVDRAAAPELTPPLSARIATLGYYAEQIGADGVLYTCSAFGTAIDAIAGSLRFPVLKPNEAMFDAALDRGLRIGMLATFAPAVPSMEVEFRNMASVRGSAAMLETWIVPEARDALAANDLATHDQLIAESASVLAHCDAIMLAHFSMATAEALVRQRVPCAVFSAPNSAVEKLRRSLEFRTA
jgi:hypothetical protein